MIKIIRDIETLNKYKPVWTSIFEADPLATPFQSFSFVISSINNLEFSQQSLFIIFVKNDQIKDWVGIFPFIRQKNGDLRFLYYSLIDFCNPIIRPEFNNYNIYEELSQFLIKDKSVKGLILDNLKSDSPLLSSFKPFFNNYICYVSDFYSLLPIYKLKNDVNPIDSFRFINNKKKKKLSKIRKNLDEYNFRVYKIENEVYPEDEIISLCEFMISEGTRSEDFLTKSMINFWKTLYNSGIMQIAIIKRDNETLACNMLFYSEKNSEIIKWITLYKESHWNMAINLMLCENLYYKGGGIINFARGIYDYKLTNYHPEVKPLLRLYLAKTNKKYLVYLYKSNFYFLLPKIKSWAIPLAKKFLKR